MSNRSEVLVSVGELPDALRAGAQLLDVRWRLGEPHEAGYQRFLDGHLPDARFLDLEAVLTGPLSDPLLGRHPLPDADQLAAGLGALGIDPGRPIVVYDEPGSFAAGRAWWVLRWAGLSVRVLDGGVKAWSASGGELVSGAAPAVELTEPRLTVGHLPTLTADEVATFDGVLIDVRAPERFRGEVEPIDPKPGHIPGAINRPVGLLWDADGRLPSDEELRRLTLGPLAIRHPGESRDLAPIAPGHPREDRHSELRTPRHPELTTPRHPGVGRDHETQAGGNRIAVYCGSGVSAAQTMLALAALGIDAALYPPSWSGWSADPERPIATGE